MTNLIICAPLFGIAFILIIKPICDQFSWKTPMGKEPANAIRVERERQYGDM